MSWILFYDGGCNLCHTSKLRVEKWAESAGQPFEAVPLQSELGLSRNYPMDSMVLEADSQVLFAENAWFKLLTIAPWFLRPLSWFSQIPGVKQLMGVGYRIVAAYRLKWFGSRACSIPAHRQNP